MELGSLNLVEIGLKLRKREISALDLYDYCFKKYSKWNPSTNAIVVPLWEEARKRLEKLEITSDNPQPLAGIPCSFKELLKLEGHPHTAGSLLRKDMRAKETAPSLKRVIDAGGQCIGLTNLAETGFWIESNNKLYGMTRNPHDLSRTTGGSSGGEAASIAVGSSFFGIGSDAGGSIRIPSSFCGVFGHKPSGGLISVEGHYPYENISESSLSEDRYQFLVIGPMARHAVDLKVLTKILSDKKLPSWDEISSSSFQARKDFSGLKILYSRKPRFRFSFPYADEQVAAVDASLELLARTGAKLQEVDTALFEDVIFMWFSAFKEAGDRKFADWIYNSENKSPVLEMFLWACGLSKHTFGCVNIALVEKAFESKRVRSYFLKKLDRLHLQIKEWMQPRHALIFPGFPIQAPRHHMMHLSPFSLAICGVFNILKLPSTSIPFFTQGQKLPASIQVISAQNNDDLCFDIAMRLEEDSRFRWRPPLEMASES